MIDVALASVTRLICGPTVEWRCDPNAAAQRIYFGNHSSHLDFIVIWSALPARAARSARPLPDATTGNTVLLAAYLAGPCFHAVLIDRAQPGHRTATAAARARSSAWPPKWERGIR